MANLSNFTHVFRADIKAPSSQKRVYKRTRFPVSCLPCRERKSRCDKGQPVCGSCAKRDDAASCKYTTASSFASAGSTGGLLPEAARMDASDDPMPRRKVALRLQQLEQLVNGLVASNRAPPITSRDISEQTPDDALSDAEAGPLPEAAPMDGFQNAQGTGSTRSHSPQASQTVGHLSSGGQFVGATHWEAVLESIQDLQEYLEETESISSPVVLTPESPAVGETDFLFGPIDRITTSEVLEVLPPRQEADNLLSVYFKDKFAASPLLHVPRFRRTYEEFWRNPHEASFLWISILFSTLSVGVMLRDSRDGSPNPLRLRYMEHALRCLHAGEYLNAKPYSVEAVILHCLSRMAEMKQPDPYLWSIFGVATRLAQRMGYHRDPDSLKSGRNAKITPFEGEMRRRTWFVVEAFDLMYSFQLGMPTIIHEAECDVQSPNNLLDDDFDVDTEVLPPSRPETEVTPVLYFRHKSRVIRMLRRLGRHALRTDQPEYSTTVELDAELRATHDLVPPAFRYIAIRDAPFTDPSYQILQRMTLEVMHLKALCILHRPYLTFGKDDLRYDLSRKTCREAALAIMELHADLFGALRQGGRLYCDRHLPTNVTIHDFLLAAMILCLDLNESDLEPSDRSLKLAILKDAYGTWSRRRHTSREAQHATNVLGAMLKKVSLIGKAVPGAASAAPEPASFILPTAPNESRDPTVNNGMATGVAGLDEPKVPVPSIHATGLNTRAGTHPGVLLPGCSHAFVEEESSAGFSTVSVFDFTSWDLENPMESLGTEDVEMDLVPLDTFIGDPNNLDWSLIDSFLLQTDASAVPPTVGLAPGPAPTQANVEVQQPGRERPNIYH